MGSELLGDVIVSVETARRQAARARHDLMAETTMLLVHGVLHLLGWDHETAAKDRRMRAETTRLVALATGAVRRASATPKKKPRLAPIAGPASPPAARRSRRRKA